MATWRLGNRVEHIPPKHSGDPKTQYLCDYNEGKPCDYKGKGGPGYCEGCCRCPF